ncbi:hypothetical protein PG990_009015 [Apiospora arundinis]
MKYTTVAASLLPLAQAASTGDRQLFKSDVKYKISEFETICEDAYGVKWCGYEFQISTSDNPLFGEGCSSVDKTTDGKLSSAPLTECGTFAFAVEKQGDGNSFIVTVNHKQKYLTGNFTIRRDELKSVEPQTVTMDDETTYQPWYEQLSYRDGDAFDVDTQRTVMMEGDEGYDELVYSMALTATETGMPTAKAAMATAVSSGSPASASASPTVAAKASTTGTETSTSTSPSETNGATREGAFAGVMFGMGLMAFAF